MEMVGGAGGAVRCRPDQLGDAAHMGGGSGLVFSAELSHVGAYFKHVPRVAE